MTVIGSSRDTLLTFQRPRPTNSPLPEPPSSIPAVEDIKTVDELYILGDRSEKFRNPSGGLNYYREALKRDSGDVRCNTAIGILMLKDGRFEEALERFNKALEWNPAYCKTIYYKGLTLLWLGEPERAEDLFNKAAYDQAWYPAAHFELAQLAAAGKRFDIALIVDLH